MDKSEADIESLKRELESRDAKRRADQLRSALMALIVSVLGLAGALATSFSQTDNLFGSKTKRPNPILADISGLQLKLAAMDSQVAQINELVKTLNTPAPMAVISVEQKKMASELTAIDDRLKRIEAAIIESPERSLSIPLLRKDIDESARRAEEYRAASRSDIDRLYEQQKWMLGGIGTVLLAVIGGAITVIFRSLPKAKGDDV